MALLRYRIKAFPKASPSRTHVEITEGPVVELVRHRVEIRKYITPEPTYASASTSNTYWTTTGGTTVTGSMGAATMQYVVYHESPEPFGPRGWYPLLPC